MSNEGIFLSLENPPICGPAVTRWEEMLFEAGCLNAPREFGGAFDEELERATREFQEKRGLEVTGIVDSTTWGAMDTERDNAALSSLAMGDASAAKDPVFYLIDGVPIIDCRGQAGEPKYGLHPWPEPVTGVMLHRTACVLGETAKRWFPVNAHIGVTRYGQIILIHPLNKMIWHGNGPSRWTIGIEFDGNPEGAPGVFWKPGGGPHPITAAQEKASVVLLQFLLFWFGTGSLGNIEYILAHRQSSPEREYDPGWECWSKIAVPWMEKTGAIPGPREGCPATKGLVEPVGHAGDTWGGGLQIPTEWDSRASKSFMEFR